MDYELGNKKMPWNYWQSIERKEKSKLDRKDNYPTFSILKKALNKEIVMDRTYEGENTHKTVINIGFNPVVLPK